MEMLLRKSNFVELAGMLERNQACSSAPHLRDAAARTRARKTAKRNGIWQRLTHAFNPTRDIPVRKRSTFRNFTRNGNRTIHLAVEHARTQELEDAALALWLDHPKADLDYLQDLLWAYCDDWTWMMAAHEYCTVDLGSATKAARFAEILYALEDRIEPEVKVRVRTEIEKRVLRPVWDYDNTEFWHSAYMNWNHVCNGGFIRAALLEIPDSRKLARAIHPAILNMTYALDGFTADGGCKEGTSYWGYGFGHFVQAAYALHCRTGGELNIMAHNKIARICRFPLATHIRGDERATFADSGRGYVAPLQAMQINHFHQIPELYELCAREPSHTQAETGAVRLQVTDMHSLALYHNQKATGKADHRDYYLPDLGMVKLRGTPGKLQMTLIALAGNNGVPHNHNDIGSFIVHKQGRQILTDPGAPRYNAQTFRGNRYGIIFCRSKGHSVPIINGREQEAGAQYFGTLSVEGLAGPGTKQAVLDLSHAYPGKILQSLIRTLALDASSNALTISDCYTFTRMPRSLEEAFVTFETVTPNQDGSSLRIGPMRGGATLTTKQPGTFQVNTIQEQPEHVPPGKPPIRRICFVPQTLSKTMTLTFKLQ